MPQYQNDATVSAMRAATYARYSSDLQDKRSIADQQAFCRDFADKSGFQIVAEFADEASTGATVLNRPGLSALLQAAKRKAFDVVIVEALNRISRDMADLPTVFKQLEFLRIPIIQVHGGKSDAMSVGLHGIMGAYFLKDLGDKTRRGQAGRVREGKIAGGKSYGHTPIPGKPGERQIDEGEAAIVRRIFAEFVAGSSTRKIAKCLNDDGIPPPSPDAKCWNSSTLGGSAKRQTGILRNALYIGTIVWNRQHFVRDPETGKRVSRENPPEQWKTADAPHLRIIAQDVWDAAQARLSARSMPNMTFRPRTKRLLSGLIKCGECGSGMAISGQNHPNKRVVRCSRNRESGACSHKKSYSLEAIEGTVIAVLAETLSSPELVAEMLEAYQTERRARIAELSKDRGRIEDELAKALASRDRVVDMVASGLFGKEEVAARMPAIRDEIARCERALEEAEPVPVVELHPQMVARYRNVVENFRSLMASGAPACAETAAALRELVDSVIVTQSESGKGSIKIMGKLSALLGEEIGVANGAIRMVAGAGFSRNSTMQNRTISLGQRLLGRTLTPLRRVG